MRIDPKTFTFDSLERGVLVRAIDSRLAVVRRNLYRDQRSINAGGERVKARIDAAELEIARLTDLRSSLEAMA